MNGIVTLEKTQYQLARVKMDVVLTAHAYPNSRQLTADRMIEHYIVAKKQRFISVHDHLKQLLVFGTLMYHSDI